MPITEKLLGQLRPANTTAASLYSPPANTRGVGKTLIIVNTTTTAAKFRVFADADGSTFDETTALFWDQTLLGESTLQSDTFMALDDSNGNIGVRTDTANALTFTLFGAEITD